MHISDEVAAYCFDKAITYFGQMFEADLEAASEGADTKHKAVTARQRVMDAWLDDLYKNDEDRLKGRFRDPARG